MLRSLKNVSEYHGLTNDALMVKSGLTELFDVLQELDQTAPWELSETTPLIAFRPGVIESMIEELAPALVAESSRKNALSAIESVFGIIRYELLSATDRLAADNRPNPTGGESLQKHIQTVNSVNRQLGLREAMIRAVETAEESARHIQEVAGEAAEGGLAIHFRDYAKKQRATADFLRYAVVGIAVVVMSVIIFLFSTSTSRLTWIDLVKKSSISIGGAALATYLARESNRHRGRADWAETIEVQLRTLSAFTDSLDEESKVKIRGDFGKRIFGESLAPAMPDIPKEASFINVGDLNGEALLKIIGAISGASQDKSSNRKG